MKTRKKYFKKGSKRKYLKKGLRRKTVKRRSRRKTVKKGRRKTVKKGRRKNFRTQNKRKKYHGGMDQEEEVEFEFEEDKEGVGIKLLPKGTEEEFVSLDLEEITEEMKNKNLEQNKEMSKNYMALKTLISLDGNSCMYCKEDFGDDKNRLMQHAISFKTMCPSVKGKKKKENAKSFNARLELLKEFYPDADELLKIEEITI